MSYLGTNKIGKMYLGSTEIVKAYLGSDLVYKKKSALPYDAEIEYLESTGTQYIDTDIYANNDTSVSMRARQTVVFNDNCFIGMDDGSSNSNSFSVEYFYTTQSRLGTLLNLDGVMSLYKNSTIGDTNWHIISASKDELTFDGNVYNTHASTPSTFTATYPLFMYAFGRNGSPLIYSKVSMSYCKIFSNGVLVRDFVPVRIGQTGYMYDKVTGQLFGNSGTGDFVLGPDKQLPTSYDAEIEYLESTGTLYIDTGIFTQAQNTRLIIEFSYDNLSGRQLHGGGNYLYFGVNDNRWEVAYNSYINDANTQKHTFEKSVNATGGRYNIKTYIDETLEYNLLFESGSDGLIYLFALCSNSNPVLYSSGKLYNCKIYVNDILVWDAIPVRVGQVGYMYDKISGQLFGNSGTGNFILGNDKN